ncbi:MAG TPA: hypothetical protein VIS49_08530 [Cyclobacteriaceae bacterium]
MMLIPLFMSMNVWGQNLYSARGYWLESTKPAYLTILDKWESGQTLTTDEAAYKQDYEAYLLTYYNRLSADEHLIYQQMKEEWDRELALPQRVTPSSPQQTQPQQVEKTEFIWRGRDRAINAAYGIYYGAALSSIAGFEGPGAVGTAFVTGGLWMLGPVINPGKYEGITENTMRAANTGKVLGLMYGASIGIAAFGEEEHPTKAILALSTMGSIALGEIAFQVQKKNSTSGGKIELMRHYGFLGTGVGGSIMVATNPDNANLLGLGLLTGGVGGLLIGKGMANQYDYTRGDVDALSALGVIGGGLGLATAISASENSNNLSRAIWLVPASVAVAGTLIGQRQVRGVHLTKKQGSIINLSSAGGALIGFGVTLMASPDSPATWVAIPSSMALIFHQLVLYGFKKDNLLRDLKSEKVRNKKFDLTMRAMPENYFVNKYAPARVLADPRLAAASPLVNITLRFR